MILPYQNDHAVVQGWEYLPANSWETFSVGEVLSIGGGAGMVTEYVDGSTPSYLSMSNVVNENGQLPVLHISKDAIFVGPFTDPVDSLVVGSYVSIGPGSDKFTSAYGESVAQVVKFDVRKTGVLVYVRFL